MSPTSRPKHEREFCVDVRKLDDLAGELPDSIEELKRMGVTRVITLQGYPGAIALVYRYGINRYVRVFGSSRLFEQWRKAGYPKD